MRYVLIDRLLELERGKRAVAVKCVTKGEAFVRDLPAYPAPLVLEALLQTGGILARAATGHEKATVLGRVNRAEFPAEARAGDRIRLEVAEVMSRADGTLFEGMATVGERVVGKAEFLLVFLPPEMSPRPDPETRARRRLLMKALHIPLEEA